MRPALGVIGAGRVGNALARLLAAQGWPITAVYSRTPEHARALAGVVGAETVPDAAAVLGRAELTLLTVPDDAIGPLVPELAASAVPGRAAVHSSGALGVESLRRWPGGECAWAACTRPFHSLAAKRRA